VALTQFSGVSEEYRLHARVERRDRDRKQTLRVRPIFVHKDDRVEALVGVVGLARSSSA
jgi:hypothetical protein